MPEHIHHRMPWVDIYTEPDHIHLRQEETSVGISTPARAAMSLPCGLLLDQLLTSGFIVATKLSQVVEPVSPVRKSHNVYRANLLLISHILLAVGLEFLLTI